MLQGLDQHDRINVYVSPFTFQGKKESHHAESIIVSLVRKHFPCHSRIGEGHEGGLCRGRDGPHPGRRHRGRLVLLRQGQSYASKSATETLSSAQVTNVLKASTTSPVEPIMHSQAVSAASHKLDSIHTDIYFEVGRRGLTDEAKAILATQADLAKSDPDLGILCRAIRIDRVLPSTIGSSA